MKGNEGKQQGDKPSEAKIPSADKTDDTITIVVDDGTTRVTETKEAGGEAGSIKWAIITCKQIA